MASTQIDRISNPTINGSLAIKAPCRVATTADINASLTGGNLGSGGGGLITIDGVALNANDRVLVKNQADQTTNGIWVATATAWQRDVDANSNTSWLKGTIVLVTDGTASAGLFYELTTANPVTIGSSSLAFAVTSNPTVSGAMSPVVGAATLAAARTAMGLGASSVEALGAAIGDDGAGNLTIKANGATNAMLAQMATKTLKGNSTGGTATPTDLSVASVLTLLMSGGGLRGHLAGLTLSNDGVSPNTVLDISAGSCADSTNTVIISLGAFTKSTAGAFVAGSGNNGMGVGLTIANSTWYHVFAIIVNGAADVYFDTDIGAANKPAGTTAFRRIGSFKTDGTAHILAFSQNGDEFLWATTVTDVNIATLGTAAALQTLPSVPLGVKVIARLRTAISHTSVGIQVLLTSPDETDQAPTGSVQTLETQVSATGIPVTVDIRVNTSQQIRARSSSASTSLLVSPYGWTDTRGRFN